MRLEWTEFTVWVEENYQQQKPTISSVVDQVNHMAEDLCQDNLDCLLHSPALTELRNCWGNVLEHLRHTNGELSAYWMSYIDLVETVLLGLLRLLLQKKSNSGSLFVAMVTRKDGQLQFCNILKVLIKTFQMRYYMSRSAHKSFLGNKMCQFS